MYVIDTSDNTPQQPPVITSHPQDVQVQEGRHVILEVKAYGTMPLHYQWYHQFKTIDGMLNHVMYMSVPICCFTGENTSFYSIHPATKSVAGHYWCTVGNQYDVEKSRPAVVTVTNSPTATYSATDSRINLKSVIPPIQDYSATDSRINLKSVIPPIQDYSATDSRINLKSVIPPIQDYSATDSGVIYPTNLKSITFQTHDATLLTDVQS